MARDRARGTFRDSTKEAALTARNSSILLFAAYGLLSLMVLVPINLVDMPALADYPNHLARMHILEAYDTSPALRARYTVHWSLIPYLSMDLIVPRLARFMSIYTAGRVFLSACVLLPVLSVIAISYAARGRVGVEPMLAFLVSYNGVLSWGLMNYLFTAPLALILFAVWIRTQQWPAWLRVLTFCPLIFVIYLFHVFGFVVYCITVAGYEIARSLRTRFKSPQTEIVNWIVAALPALPALIMLARFHVSDGLIGPLKTVWGNASIKREALESPIAFLPPSHEIIYWSALSIALVLGIWRFGFREMRLSPAIWPSAGVMAVIAVVTPAELQGVHIVDFRLPLIVVLLLIGALSLRLDHSARVAFVAGVMALVGLESALAAVTLKTLDVQTVDIRKLVANMPRGARMLVVDSFDPEPSRLFRTEHASAYLALVATIDRDAFVPILYSAVMTVNVAPRFRQSSTPFGRPIDMQQLRDGLTRRDEDGVEQADGGGGRIYWWGWPEKFDYVLIAHPNGPCPKPPGILTRVGTSPTADLFLIRHGFDKSTTASRGAG